MATQSQNQETRIGVPSIEPRTIPSFFGIFSVGTITLTAIATWSTVTAGDVGAWHEITRVAIDQATRAAAASLAGAVIAVEAGDMVIGAMIRRRAREQGLEKGREEGREEGRKEGREEGQATVQKLWTEWNQRRLAAEASGEPFSEAPPQTNGQNPPN